MLGEVRDRMPTHVLRSLLERVVGNRRPRSLGRLGRCERRPRLGIRREQEVDLSADPVGEVAFRRRELFNRRPLAVGVRHSRDAHALPSRTSSQ